MLSTSPNCINRRGISVELAQMKWRGPEVRGGSVGLPSEGCCTLQVVDDWDKGEDVEPRVQHLSLERTAPKNPNGTSTQAENFVLFMCLGIQKKLCAGTLRKMCARCGHAMQRRVRRASSWVNSDWRTGRMVLFVITGNKALSTVLQRLTK